MHAFKDLSTHAQNLNTLANLITHLEIFFLHIYKSDYGYTDCDTVTQLSTHIYKQFCYNNTPIHKDCS